MKIEFNAYEHDNPKDSQLIVAITGTPEYIKERLGSLLLECESSYGKPKQGIITHGKGSIDIITPIWKGQKY